MALVVSSEVVSDEPQVDGRRWVRERHVLDAGNPIDVQWLAPADADVQGVMLARVSEIAVAMAVL